MSIQGNVNQILSLAAIVTSQLPSTKARAENVKIKKADENLLKNISAEESVISEAVAKAESEINPRGRNSKNKSSQYENLSKKYEELGQAQKQREEYALKKFKSNPTMENYENVESARAFVRTSYDRAEAARFRSIEVLNAARRSKNATINSGGDKI